MKVSHTQRESVVDGLSEAIYFCLVGLAFTLLRPQPFTALPSFVHAVTTYFRACIWLLDLPC